MIGSRLGKVSEMRMPYGPGWRVYFVRRGRVIVIMLNAGDILFKGLDGVAFCIQPKLTVRTEDTSSAWVTVRFDEAAAD